MNKKEKYIWTCKVTSKGQIAIPKEAREVFDIHEGDTLVLLGDINQGIAMAKFDDYAKFAQAIIDSNKE